MSENGDDSAGDAWALLALKNATGNCGGGGGESGDHDFADSEGTWDFVMNIFFP